MIKSSSYSRITLFILPVALLSIGLHYIFISAPYFLGGVDPEYAYLLNGLLIADLKLKVSFMYHPGTPVQCISAVIMWIVHAFRPGNSLVHDVMLYPELYIRAILIALDILNALALFLMGWWVYRTFHNLHVALFLQLTPFTQVITLEVLRRLMPEPLMNILVCGWICMIMLFIYRDAGDLNLKRCTFLFGLLFGISLADKLSFLPFFILPLILLPEWRHKLMFLFYATVSFLIFAFPVTLNLNIFYNWVKDIVMHTGNYGGGERGIIKWNEFLNHFIMQYSATGVLPGVVLILVLLTIVFILKNRKYKHPKSVKIQVSIALILVVAFEYLISSKHFAYHYMIPAILLTVIGFLLVILILTDLLPRVFKPFVMNWVLILSGIFILAYTTPRLIGQIEQIKQIAAARNDAFTRIKPFLNARPRIISASYYGCAQVEYALTFGIHESGRYSKYLTDNLKKLYPSTFVYFPWGKVFYQGILNVQPADFINPSQNYALYIADYSNDLKDEITTSLMHDFPGRRLIITQMFVNSIQHEGVFLLQFID